MKIVTGWVALADAIGKTQNGGCSIPTARKIVKRDRAVRKVVSFLHTHPYCDVRALVAAIGGRDLKMKRGHK